MTLSRDDSTVNIILVIIIIIITVRAGELNNCIVHTYIIYLVFADNSVYVVGRRRSRSVLGWVTIHWRILCTDQLVSLQSKLAEKEQEMDSQIQQLRIQHEINIKQLQAKHEADIDRIHAGYT